VPELLVAVKSQPVGVLSKALVVSGGVRSGGALGRDGRLQVDNKVAADTFAGGINA
jgi:hypothetical protein